MPSATSETSPALAHPALLTATNCTGQTHLVIGNNALASSRCQKSLDAGANVTVISPGPLSPALQRRVEAHEVVWHDREFASSDLTTLGRAEVDHVVDLVFVTLPVDCAQCALISNLCRRLRIPVNVVDAPALCTFTLLSTYTSGALQLGVTTSGTGCKLATRIKRELAATLPPTLGAACQTLGDFRRQLQPHTPDDDGEQPSDFNTLVRENDPAAHTTRRLRWLSQISEYWPLTQLAAVTPASLQQLLETTPPATPTGSPTPPPHTPGKITLVGAGPGHPDLLTTAALKAVQSADLVLADKLVPAGVLALVPRRTELFIARKFPGNADAAQEELLQLGLAAARAGRHVVRLKQGDPYIYGRGAEEFEFFGRHGFRPVVIPGLSSALVAPTFAEIPATHRGVADQVLLCTGTGRKGALPEWPEWVQSRTTVFLMALHRLAEVVEGLGGKGWPMEVPCCVVERASCGDQRVVRTRLGEVVRVMEEVGMRPPGLLVVGWACGILVESGKAFEVVEGFAGF